MVHKLECGEILKSLKEQLIEYSQSIGVDAIGFGDVSRFVELESLLIKRDVEKTSSLLAKGSLEERVNPLESMADAKSVISIAVAYPRESDLMPKLNKETLTVQFSRSSWGIDYHVILKEKLVLIEQWLENHVSSVSVLSQVDTGVLNDRAIALRAGIGFRGINNSVISHEFGSYIYLGSLLVNVEFEADEPLACLCGDCQRCVKACPTQALSETGDMNERRCLSFISQAKSEIEPELLKKLNKYVYGCDICQEVCPYNKDIKMPKDDALTATGIEFVHIDEILSLTQKQFKQKYGHLAGAWRGVGVLKRNALMNARYYKYRGVLPQAKQLLNSESPEWLKQSARLVIEELEKL